MKKIILAAGLLAATSVVPAYAVSPFFEVGAGQPDFVIQRNSPSSQQPFSSGAPFRENEDSKVAYGKLGLQATENLGFYILYGQGQGSADFDLNDDNLTDVSAEIDQYYGLFARISKRMNTYLGIHAQLGYNWVDFNYEFPQEMDMPSHDEEIRSFAFGLGFDVHLGDSFSLIVEWNHLADRNEFDENQNDPDATPTENLVRPAAVRIEGLYAGVRVLFPSSDDD